MTSLCVHAATPWLLTRPIRSKYIAIVGYLFMSALRLERLYPPPSGREQSVAVTCLRVVGGGDEGAAEVLGGGAGEEVGDDGVEVVEGPAFALVGLGAEFPGFQDGDLAAG